MQQLLMENGTLLLEGLVYKEFVSWFEIAQLVVFISIMEKETVGNFKIDTIEDYFNYINSKPIYQEREIKFRGIKSLPKDYIPDEKVLKRKKVPKRYKERADSIESIFKYIRYVTGKKRYSLRIRRKGEELIYKNFELASEAIKVRNSVIKNSDSLVSYWSK